MKADSPRIVKSTQRLLRLFLLFLPLSACAPVEPPGLRYLWPPGGFVQPKIEFITVYQSDADVTRGKEGWLKRAILGDEVPVPLFHRPFSIAAGDRGRVFVGDVDTGKVLVLDLEQKEVRLLGKRNGGPGSSFSFPGGLATTADGRLYVVETQRNQIHLYDRDETLVKDLTATGMVRPLGAAFDDARQRLYVADPGAHRVSVFSADGELQRNIGQRGADPGAFNFPLDLDLDAAGNLYVLDSMNARVQVFNPDGEFLRSFGERGAGSGFFSTAKSLAVSPSGHVYITDSSAHHILIYDLDGKYLMSVGGQSSVERGVSPGGFSLPQGIDVDADDGIWVVDSLNRMVQRFQYLNDRYLAEHPLVPGQVYQPEGLFTPSGTAPPPKPQP